MQEIFNHIEKERVYQKAKWGDEFDSKHTINDWAVFVNRYLSQACEYKPENRYMSLLKAATIIVAAMEMQLKNGFTPRHYDNPSV